MYRISLVFLFSFSMMACTQPLSQATKGGFIGTGLGAGTGALIGREVGNTGLGTAIGAGTGLLAGAIVGASFDAQDLEVESLQEERNEQLQQLERQRREIEDLRRQQRYDDLYRRY